MPPLNPKSPAIFHDLLLYHCLSLDQIYERHFAAFTKRYCRKVLQQLSELDYLTFVQLMSVLRPTTDPTKKRTPQSPGRIYFLQEKALEAFDPGHCQPGRVLRSEPQPHTVDHRHGISTTIIRHDHSCKEAGIALSERIYESDVRDDLPANTPPNQRKVLYNKFPHEGRSIGLCPDAATWMAVPQASGSTLSILGLWEYDRSTEGLKQLQRTKPRGYHLLLQTREYERYWNATPDVVRILWVVPSRQRIETIVKALDDYQDVLACCRFLTQTDCDAKNIVTDDVWYNPITQDYSPMVEL